MRIISFFPWFLNTSTGSLLIRKSSMLAMYEVYRSSMLSSVGIEGGVSKYLDKRYSYSNRTGNCGVMIFKVICNRVFLNLNLKQYSSVMVLRQHSEIFSF